jgi:hypothetical protein
MNARKNLLERIKVAGYHGHYREGTRLYCENRISRKVYEEAWQLGRALKANGAKCTCRECEVRL